ncbi:primosomal replication protein PriC [Pseudidiomarina insulisalsae]|uniref:primosomal replication protein PriC n=1 Tax=Pseudidiomarina insulisalsae TaxID=575789 RepID=UPI0013009708|nr:primosomal replication protein PriC [Pseudidiomarina insulisalsae]
MANEQIYQRLRQQIAALRREIIALNVSEEQFVDWFDAQLFRTTHSAPEHYCDELAQNVSQLERSSRSDQQQWLALRIEQQMLALTRALAYFQRKT